MVFYLLPVTLCQLPAYCLDKISMPVIKCFSALFGLNVLSKLYYYRFNSYRGVIELDNLKSSKKVVGVKQSAKALENGTAKTVFVARDADPKVINNIVELCSRNSIEVVYEESMKQLGKACGIEVGAAVACILK